MRHRDRDQLLGAGIERPFGEDRLREGAERLLLRRGEGPAPAALSRVARGRRSSSMGRRLALELREQHLAL